MFIGRDRRAEPQTPDAMPAAPGRAAAASNVPSVLRSTEAPPAAAGTGLSADGTVAGAAGAGCTAGAGCVAGWVAPPGPAAGVPCPAGTGAVAAGE
ncbi:hypothetical protein GCM10009589_37480 [Arthrobacter pascens]